MRYASYTIMLLAAVFSVAVGQPQSTQTRVEVRLKNRPVAVQRDLVRLSDVADISGGSKRLRDKIGDLDIELLKSDQYSATIKSKAVQIRCLLAGIRGYEFVVTGPSRCVAYLGLPQTLATSSVQTITDPETTITEAIRRSVADIWKTHTTNVSVRLTKPIEEFEARSAPISSGMVRVYPPADLKPGELKLVVLVRVPRAETPLKIAVSAVVERTDKEPQEDESVIRQASLSRTTASRASRGKVVIRTNDTVQLTAIRGALRVAITDAVALSSGKVGDVIRFRNPKSRNIVRGRVVSRSNAIIEL